MTLTEHYNTNDIEYGKMTDKSTIHDYIDGYYSDEFSSKKDDNLKILEIGIWEGGSLKIWSDFFTNAEIQAVEVNNRKWIYKPEHIKVTNKSGYEQSTLDLFEDDYFDYIIDDGPHNVQSQIYAIENWLSKVKKGGKLIIEDIQGPLALTKLENLCISKDLDFKIFDLRKNKNRFDDIIISITK
jgi:hypothetical protein|tara:strand:- start:524 stop:1075 length:552 start_codon:yes stop_codon:yes gene_type:complete